MIKILVNGKKNPLGVDFGKIRLSLETDLSYTVKEYTFNLYKDLESANNDNPFLTKKTQDYFIYIDRRLQ